MDTESKTKAKVLLEQEEDRWASKLIAAEQSNDLSGQIEALIELGNIYLASKDCDNFPKIHEKDPYIKAIALYNAAIVRDKSLEQKDLLLAKILCVEQYFFKGIGIESKSVTTDYYQDNLNAYSTLCESAKIKRKHSSKYI
jgi:hypothetical protein